MSLLGWAGKVAPTALEVPGQARNLEIVSQGEGWVNLDWKKPVDGGKVASYKIERRECPAGDWALIALAMESEGTLNNQERGKDWEYRVMPSIRLAKACPQTRSQPLFEEIYFVPTVRVIVPCRSDVGMLILPLKAGAW